MSGNAGYYNVTQHKVQSLSSMLGQIKKQCQQLNEKITNLSELEETSARNFEDQESKIDGLIAKAEGHRKDMVLYAMRSMIFSFFVAVANLRVNMTNFIEKLLPVL